MDPEMYEALLTVHGTIPKFNFEMPMFDDDNSSIPDDQLSIHLDEIEPLLGPDPPLDEIEPAVCAPDPTAGATGHDRHNEEVRQFIQESVAKSTVYKNSSAEKRFTLFCTREMNPPKTRSIEKIPPIELDRILCQFFMYAEKIDKKSTE